MSNFRFRHRLVPSKRDGDYSGRRRARKDCGRVMFGDKEGVVEGRRIRSVSLTAESECLSKPFMSVWDVLSRG